jgi:phytoene/squalene synthetase
MLPELSTKEKLRKTRRTVKWQERAHDVTETIASKDHNNLYITSSFFRDRIKNKAFCAYYAVMRIVDDRVDNLPWPNHRSEEMQKRELSVVDAWERVVNSCRQGIHPTAPQLKACEFANWSDFLVYAEGATVAPTTIYLSLIAAHRNETKNIYELPTGFDLYNCGRYLGIFAYLGHIIRDLANDITQATTRLCISREDMVAHGVSPEILRNDALRRQASPTTRSLVEDLLRRARNYLLQGRSLAMQIQDFIESDCRLILELIITMYEHIIAKIETTSFDPMGKRHFITRKEIADIVQSAAVHTGFSLPNCMVI